jgi:hypothetical protein
MPSLRLPLTTHGELNAAEQENILRARLWARGAHSIAMANMLTREFVEQLHLGMYGGVWEWAGSQRQVDTITSPRNSRSRLLWNRMATTADGRAPARLRCACEGQPRIHIIIYRQQSPQRGASFRTS